LTLRRAVVTALALSFECGGCAPTSLDVLEPTCSEFTTESACKDHLSLGCRFQPNPEGCRIDDPNCAPGICRSGDDAYVQPAVGGFSVGGKPFRFVGVSSWALLQPVGCASKIDDSVDWARIAYDELVPAGVKVARVLAPQSTVGEKGTDYRLFDAALSGARRAGIRIQFVLGVHKGECNLGPESEHDAAWYESGYRQNEPPIYALSYREFAANTATRYKDDPTVLGYTLLHGFGAAYDIDSTILTNFASDMGQLLHGIAGKQLLSLGYTWHGNAAEDLAKYHALQSLPVVDFIDVDDYIFNPTPVPPLDPGLVAELKQIGKPAVIGEGAFVLHGLHMDDFNARANMARARMEEWKRGRFAGALFWAYDPGWKEQSEEFDARQEDPMLQAGGVIASAPW